MKAEFQIVGSYITSLRFVIPYYQLITPKRLDLSRSFEVDVFLASCNAEL